LFMGNHSLGEWFSVYKKAAQPKCHAAPLALCDFSQLIQKIAGRGL